MKCNRVWTDGILNTWGGLSWGAISCGGTVGADVLDEIGVLSDWMVNWDPVGRWGVGSGVVVFYRESCIRWYD